MTCFVFPFQILGGLSGAIFMKKYFWPLGMTIFHSTIDATVSSKILLIAENNWKRTLIRMSPQTSPLPPYTDFGEFSGRRILAHWFFSATIQQLIRA